MRCHWILCNNFAGYLLHENSNLYFTVTTVFRHFRHALRRATDKIFFLKGMEICLILDCVTTSIVIRLCESFDIYINYRV